MMAPAGAAACSAPPAGNATQVGVPPASAAAAPVEALSALNSAGAAPFPQALMALVAGAEAAAGTTTKTIARSVAAAPLAAGAAEPAAAPAGGEAMPADLLLALFPHEAIPGASAQEMRQAAPSGGSDDQDAGGDLAKSGDSGLAQIVAPALDPGAALLAAVLQWLQQQGALAPRSPAAAVSAGPAAHAVTGEADARAMAASTVPGTADAGVNVLAGASAAVAPGVNATTTVAASPGAALSAQKPDSADNSATATVMDMAAALRAATSASPDPVTREVAVPVHERHWPQALAAQVLILSSEKVQAATLRLSPEHLGPLEVHIDLQDANVNVTFTAAHVETRAALEQAMPQLRAVLAGSGLTLGQATVQQQARRESQNSNAAPRTAGAAGAPPEVLAAVARALGMVDEYV